MKRRTVVQTSLAAGLVAGMVALRLSEDLPPSLDRDAPWRPTAWPFPRDAWLPGRAWRRGTLEVYVRPKLGFCGNCETGVTTDDEVDRVIDVDLLHQRFAPAKEGVGRHVRVAEHRRHRVEIAEGIRPERQALGGEHGLRADLGKGGALDHLGQPS